MDFLWICLYKQILSRLIVGPGPGRAGLQNKLGGPGRAQLGESWAGRASTFLGPLWARPNRQKWPNFEAWNTPPYYEVEHSFPNPDFVINALKVFLYQIDY